MYNRTGDVGEAPTGRNPPATVPHGPPRGPTTTASGAASAACTPCRTVKMKCTREPNETVCNRCKRKQLTCFYETHRRGRKPGTKLRPKAERDRDRELERERQRAKERNSRTKNAQQEERVHCCAGPHLCDHGNYQSSSETQASNSSRDPDTRTSSNDLNNSPTKTGVMPVAHVLKHQLSEAAMHNKSESVASDGAHSSRHARLSNSGSRDIGQSPTAIMPNRPVSSGSASGAGVSTTGSAMPSMGNTDSLAPFKLLRKSATAGNFTIANILNAEEESDTSSTNERNDADGSKSSDDMRFDEQNDPIFRGLVSLPTAQGLFESFFQYMNTFICQFDPRLHTMRYIRTKSAFLFSALLCAASKFFAPDLHHGLYDHVEAQLKEIMPAGKKSAEIVQGILLMTYWKQPSDSRAWLLVGYAIRACIEMGWHQLTPTNSEPYAMMLQPEREMELRERRNKERIWLLLFVYDRSVSLQVGKPWMIQMGPLIRASDTWHQHAYVVPGIDQVMSAFVQLRILSSELLDLCFVDPKTCAPETYQRNENILKLFNGHLDRWETRWYKTVEDASANISHRFIIHFYGTHLRLVLNSYRLQLSILGGAGISKQALWVCYMSSLEMLRLVVDRLGVGSHLFYCQDSVHAMIAYATVIMIKILLSLPGELPPESESQAMNIIRETSEAFSRQKPASNTSCYYQHRFLTNIANQYCKTKQENAFAGGQWTRRMTIMTPDSNIFKPSTTLDGISGTIAAASNLLSLDRRASAPTAVYASMMPPPQRLSASRQPQQMSPISESGPMPSIYGDMSPPDSTKAAGSVSAQQHYSQQPDFSQAARATYKQPPVTYPLPTTMPNTPMDSNPPPTQANTMTASSVPATPQDQMCPTAYGGLINGSLAAGSGIGGSAGSYQLFTDNIVWEDLFAGAGFSVNSGAFLPTNPADS